MSIDLFMNDTCPKCRQLLMPAVIDPHPTRRNLSVHKSKCSNCGAVQTSILFRKSHGSLADELVANAR
jgi:RNase P subunit RPR2